MDEYLIPAGTSETELLEKRSRFIGQVWPVTSEAQARERIESAKKRFFDARHHCWCYRLRSGAERYSDDGEPQGTAGQPMLNVFQRENVVDVVCVVTRYFGGILLGAGGLTRAYGSAAKQALDAVGVRRLRPWTTLGFPCPYPLYDRLRMLITSLEGTVADTDFGALVTVTTALPSDKVDSFTMQLTELSSGSISPEILGEELR